MIRVYDHFLSNSQNIKSGNYNAGFENISILEIAEKIKQKVSTEIVITDSNDPRSYRQNSDKLISTGFDQQYSVDYAIEEIITAFEKGLIQDKDEFYTVKTMKKLSLS